MCDAITWYLFDPQSFPHSVGLIKSILMYTGTQWLNWDTPPPCLSCFPISLFNDCTMYMLKYVIHWCKDSFPTQPIKLAKYSLHFLWPFKSFLCNAEIWPKEGLKMSIIPVPQTQNVYLQMLHVWDGVWPFIIHSTNSYEMSNKSQ